MEKYASFLGLVFSLVIIWVPGFNLLTSLADELNKIKSTFGRSIIFGTMIIIIALCAVSTGIVAEFFNCGRFL